MGGGSKQAISSSSPATVGGAASSDESAKTLSRNALYTPLRAYDQSQVSPTSYMSTLKNLPVSLKDSSLSSFMHYVSEDYHRNRITGTDPKNNGSRPLTASDMDDRLRQRAVTLVSGGINSSLSTLKPRAKNQVPAKHSKKRPRRAWEQVQEIIMKKTSNTPTKALHSIEFLTSMNKRWNSYFLQILNVDIGSNEIKRESKIRSSLARLWDEIEVAGAHVAIRSCKPKRHLINNFGVLIGQTRNTWSVALRRTFARQESPIQKAKTKSDVRCSETSAQPIEIVVVPKDGSTLVLIIPISQEETDEGVDTREQSHGSSGANHLQIIPLAPKCVFVTLSRVGKGEIKK